MSDLYARLETPLPARLPAGSATAVFCYGACFHRSEHVRELAILVDGVAHRPAAVRMPRPDLAPALGGPSAEYPEDRTYRSGFWATVPVAAGAPGTTIDLQAAVRLGSGREEIAPLARIEVMDPDSPQSWDDLPVERAGLIAVCMATFDPDPELFRIQIDSLREQTERRWVCVISDDESSPEHFAQIEETVGDDPRFRISRSDRHLSFYRNFERALRLAPPEAELLALCDQDDRWYPDKLETLRGALGSAQLAYSDQRLVDAEGRVLRETMWEGRRNNHTSLASMLVANTITGAASLFRREVAALALPFPQTPGLRFHDHWLALVALAAGDVAYVDRPLYDYVQHPGAVFGDVAKGHRRGPRQAPWRGGRRDYFFGYLPRDMQARALLVACESRLEPRKRRALRRFVASARSPLALAWLATRPLRALIGRNETLGSEGALARGILWRWLVGAGSRWSRAPGRLGWNASMPPVLTAEGRGLRRWRARL